MPTTDDDLRIVDNPTLHRYEAQLGGEIVGISQYRLEPGRIVFFHTQVDRAVEGGGIGSRLVRGLLDDARARGLKVVAECPFIAAYLRRHPADYADIVEG